MSISVQVNYQWMRLETCAQCKVPFCMDESTYQAMSRLKEQGTFCCPLGHKQNYITGEHPETKLRRENERLKQEQARLIEEANEAREQAKKDQAVLKGKLTRVKNRISKGVCPDCNRTFGDLARHMSTKHALVCEAA